MKHTLFAAAAVLAAGLQFAATEPAHAIDKDVDFYCYDVTWPDGSETVECDAIGDIQAECKATDPDNVGDECKDVNGNKRRPGLKANDPPKPGIGTFKQRNTRTKTFKRTKLRKRTFTRTLSRKRRAQRSRR